MQKFRYLNGSRAAQLRNTVLTAKGDFYEDLFYISHTYYTAQQRRSLRHFAVPLKAWNFSTRSGSVKAWDIEQGMRRAGLGHQRGDCTE